MSSLAAVPAGQFRLGNYAFAGIVPGRDPLYLPDSTTRDSGVGYARNLTLNQTPMTESTFLTGDGKRKIVPLVLSGTFVGLSEEGARLWAAALDDSVVLWTQVQRSADVVRDLLPGGYVEWPKTTKPHIILFTLTLYPAGPSWLDGNGNPVPF